MASSCAAGFASGTTSSYVYIILVTSRDGTDNVVEGLNAGADDFITKPFHPAELRVRVRSGVRLLSLESRNLTIFTLAKLAESRSPRNGRASGADAGILPRAGRPAFPQKEILKRD